MKNKHWSNRNPNFVPNEIEEIIFSRYCKPHFKVLEIGCSKGHKLNNLYQKFRCKCFGIDIDKKAVARGKKLYPKLNLKFGYAWDLKKYRDEFFDFVILGFCLYLVERNKLAQTISETDRVLKNGGFLGITDFNMKIPSKRVYDHDETKYLYKMDYCSIFSSFPQYFLIERQNYKDDLKSFEYDNEDVSIFSAVLKKDNENAYKTLSKKPIRKP